MTVGHDYNKFTRKDQPMRSHPVDYIEMVEALNGTTHANTDFLPRSFSYGSKAYPHGNEWNVLTFDI